MAQKLTSSLEDYLETICILSQKDPVVRSRDIARKLGVTMPSVTEAMRKLAGAGLVNYEKYGYITLTSKGTDLAQQIYSHHKILSRFFRDILRIKMEIAEEDACKIEHHASLETLRRLKTFIEFMESYSRDHSDWIESLNQRLEQNKTKKAGSQISNGCL